jgi:GNAT superfamily N-acetyltransferase
VGAPSSALPAGIVLAREGFGSEGPQWVMAQAEAEIVVRYGELNDDERGLTEAMFEPPAGAFLIARASAAGLPLGGVGVRALSPGIGEVRRLWIDPGRRRQGIARLLIAALEDASRDIGLRTLCLTTGQRQPEAIALYLSMGWRQVALDKAAVGFRFTKKLGAPT